MGRKRKPPRKYAKNPAYAESYPKPAFEVVTTSLRIRADLKALATKMAQDIGENFNGFVRRLVAEGCARPDLASVNPQGRQSREPHSPENLS